MSDNNNSNSNNKFPFSNPSLPAGASPGLQREVSDFCLSALFLQLWWGSGAQRDKLHRNPKSLCACSRPSRLDFRRGTGTFLLDLTGGRTSDTWRVVSAFLARVLSGAKAQGEEAVDGTRKAHHLAHSCRYSPTSPAVLPPWKLKFFSVRP